MFPDVKLEKSTHVLQNFNKRLIKAIGSFRCFLRWKGHKYRVKFEVMGIETPNLLSRETTFLMGILKKCLVVEEAVNNPISPTSVSGPSTEGVFSYSVPPTEDDPLASTEGVFSHLVPPMEENPLTSMDSLASMDSVPLTEGVFDHSVSSTEGNPLLASTENRM